MARPCARTTSTRPSRPLLHYYKREALSPTQYKREALSPTHYKREALSPTHFKREALGPTQTVRP